MSSAEQTPGSATNTPNSYSNSPASVGTTDSNGVQPIPKKSLLIKTDKPRPFICQICTRGFARLEHLKRHERSHTNEKPFQCAACGRCFARRDLVLRHQQKLHASLDTQETTKKRKVENKNIITKFGNKEHLLPTPENGEPSITAVMNEASEHELSPTKISQTLVQSVTKPTKPEREFVGSLFGNLQPPAPTTTAAKDHPKRHRHASFSASSAVSYTQAKDAKEIMLDSIPEPPHQVGFATPQMSAQELIDKAAMAGMDLEALGVDDDIGPLDLDAGYFGLEHEHETYQHLNDAGDGALNGSTNGSAGAAGTAHRRHDPHTPFHFALTPGGTHLNVPLLQDFLHVGSIGGGAGFVEDEDSSLGEFKFQHKKFNFVEPEAMKRVKKSHSQLQMAAQSSVSEISDSRAASGQDDWLSEFIDTPFNENFEVAPSTLNSIGFASHHVSPVLASGSLPSSSTAQTPLVISPKDDDIPSLFRSRQIDLFKKIMENASLSPPTAQNSDKKARKLVLFTQELREQILKENHLNASQFPTLKELNQYVDLYVKEFDKYFPFIHLSSIVPSMENNPLLLSIAVIGALYGFHSSHAMLLFNITRFRIREFLEHKRPNLLHEVPLWIIQSSLLLIFIGIFNNDLSITKTMNTQLNSLVELVKITNINQPLISCMHPPEHDNDQEAWEYFILAQSRIRTCHSLLLISNLFTSLVGLDCCLHSIDLKCGIPCYETELWTSDSAYGWKDILQQKGIVLDSKFDLVNVCNGGESYKNCLVYLTSGYQVFFETKRISFKTLLSLLMSIHEKIYIERYNLKDETSPELHEIKWRMNSRPVIESLLKFWEALYIKNGGIMVPNASNLHIISENPTLRLILPLLSFAKIRKCVSLTRIMNKIWLKDWTGMNAQLEILCHSDMDSLRETTDYALNTVNLWIDCLSINNNAEKTSIRTPIFFITCIFSSILIISEYLKNVEGWAVQYESGKGMKAIDRTLWLKSEEVFQKIERHLLPKGYNMKSYAEFLRVQANGALDVEPLDNDRCKNAMNPQTDINETVKVIRDARLSSRSLYLGVRILGDAPIWPIALLFAQALQSRAIHNGSS